MAALISILLEMPKGDAMPSSGFSIRTTWATKICKEKNFISRIQVQRHGIRTTKAAYTTCNSTRQTIQGADGRDNEVLVAERYCDLHSWSACAKGVSFKH